MSLKNLNKHFIFIAFHPIRFACNAKNYDLVMTAARHYWNACLPLINQPMERELLKEPLTILLECIRDTTDKNMFKKEEVCLITC